MVSGRAKALCLWAGVAALLQQQQHGVADAADPIIRGFDQGVSPAPVVPGKMQDLVVESVWQFDTNGSWDDHIVAVKFVPGSTKVLALRKRGEILIIDSPDKPVTDFQTLMDMTDAVDSEGDHGLLSLAFHPNFPTVPQIFVGYTGNPQDVNVDVPNNAAISKLRPPGWGELPAGTTGFVWPRDICPDLGQDNYGGVFCEKRYYIDRLTADLEAATPTLVKDMTIFRGACGSTLSHGPGNLIEAGANLIWSEGEGSQFDPFDEKYVPAPYNIIDYGQQAADGCYDPKLPMPQGQFRSQRNEFANGKIMMFTPELLATRQILTPDKVLMVSKGSRQPFRVSYRASKDELWIGDVGQGDSGTTERIFVAPQVTTRTLAKQPPLNWGWPCIEGLYLSSQNMQKDPTKFNPYDCPSEQARQRYLKEKKLNTCDGIYNAVTQYTTGKPVAGADPMWQAPQFEYRRGVLDPEFPQYCSDINAAITSVMYAESKALPPAMQGKVLFSDRVRGCVYYLEVDANGRVDKTKSPHLLLTNHVVIHMEQAPDGSIYMTDFDNFRVTRMFAYGGLLGGDNAVATEAVTPAPTPAPVVLPTDIPNSAGCFKPTEMPELGWQRQPNGVYTADLVLGAVNMNAGALGTMRTRAFNGMFPGPIIRMKACNTYQLTLVNDQAEWPAGFPEGKQLNGFFGPTVTNLHTHGLHISGDAPGDDVSIHIEPGEMYTYTYTIPCDHVGGTHWYHPHKHGAVALQADGGAAGLVIIDPNPREAVATPAPIQTMPEQYFVVQEMDPANLKAFAVGAQDSLFDTTIQEAFLMVNGCTVPTGVPSTVEAGQWTRFRVLHFGRTMNAILTVKPAAAGAAPCDVVLLAKDGVPVADAPRARPKGDIFVSISSRADFAIRCPVAGANMHTLAYEHVNIGDGAAGAAATAATGGVGPSVVSVITVAASARAAAADLPAWKPCRPAYLMDAAAAQTVAPALQVDVRDAINGQVYTGPGNYFETLTLGTVYPWTVTSSDTHPFHVHVNHFQLGAVGVTNQWAAIPDWNQPGDWVDTISAPGNLPVFLHPERYVGKMVMHCHIAEHSDKGIMAINLIQAQAGIAAPTTPAVTDFGTCTTAPPPSKPFTGAAAAVPGLIQAENFDLGGEGVAYHNVNIDRGAANAVRVGEAAVETDLLGTATAVTYIRDGEWLKYTVNVARAGNYALTLAVASAQPVPLVVSLWMDADEGCPAMGGGGTLLLAVDEEQWQGTQGAFQPYAAAGAFPLPAGPHTISLCFAGGFGGFAIDSFAITLQR